MKSRSDERIGEMIGLRQISEALQLSAHALARA